MCGDGGQSGSSEGMGVLYTSPSLFSTNLVLQKKRGSLRNVNHRLRDNWIVGST